VEFVVLGIVLAVVFVGALVAFLRAPGRGELPPAEPSTTQTLQAPPAAAEEHTPTAAATATVDVAPVVAAAPQLEVPPPSAGRMVRLRGRLARSQTGLGRGLLTLLARDTIDEDTWDEVEETLLTADVGVGATQQIVENLRTQVKVLGARTPEQVRTMLRDQLLVALGASGLGAGGLGADLDRSLRTSAHEGEGRQRTPAVVLMVGVNGTGKTTTCGKLGRALVGDGRRVVLGAADTFRAAAADQLSTWAERVGAHVVRGPEGGDPASVAFDAVKQGTEEGVDVVLIDTAGRLHTKQGLMDELGKVKRVVERQGPVDEVLLVLDATTGQNGLMQARVFGEVVDVTGIVLTKLDGTAKGGIVIAVQRELGVPVKLVGLGEGPDDLAPFEPEAFVDALLGEPETE
jgi:fused signal recognition particle receptor